MVRSGVYSPGSHLSCLASNTGTYSCTYARFFCYFRASFLCQANRCSDEIAEQRMWSIGTALKFRMELRAYKPGMVRQLYDLDQTIVGGTTAHNHPVCFHALAVFVVEFVALAMALK